MRTPNNERLTSDIADAPRHRPAEPERRCILSGEIAPRDTLVRLAISPDGLVLPDAHEKAPGRGAWYSGSRADLEAAIASGKLRGGLARSFKGEPLTVPEDLPQRIKDALTRVFCERLGLEMRVGSLILGTHRIADAARNGAVALLLHASDASEDGRKKLDQAWRVGRGAEGTGERGPCLPLDRAALSVALGRENVVHLALTDDRAAGRVMKPLARLMQYLGAPLPRIADRPEAEPDAHTDGRAPTGSRADETI